MALRVRVFMVTDERIPGQRRRLGHMDVASLLIPRCAPTLRHH